MLYCIKKDCHIVSKIFFEWKIMKVICKSTFQGLYLKMTERYTEPKELFYGVDES